MKLKNTKYSGSTPEIAFDDYVFPVFSMCNLIMSDFNFVECIYGHVTRETDICSTRHQK